MHLERSQDADASLSMHRSIFTLVITTWLLASVLILCIILRLLYSFKTQAHHQTRLFDDVLITLVCVSAVASMLTMPTIVIDAAPRSNTTNAVQTSGTMASLYASTILFTITLGLSKMPLLLWLRQLEPARVYRACTITILCAILAYTVASTTSVIFQCEVPVPWDTITGQCITTQSFWTTIVAVDITLDMILIIVPVMVVRSLGVQQRSESWVSIVLCLRTLLIVASLMRLVYLKQLALGGYSPILESLPYAIATQCQVAIAFILACTPAVPCLASLIKVSSRNPQLLLNKHWSGSSFGSDIATDYFASAPSDPIQEHLSVIQASMATPTSSCHGSHHGQMIPPSRSLGAKVAPRRPTSPSVDQRPDMSMFTRRPTVMRPPPVTLLRESCNDAHDSTLYKRVCGVEGAIRTSKHVKFIV